MLGGAVPLSRRSIGRGALASAAALVLAGCQGGGAPGPSPSASSSSASPKGPLVVGSIGTSVGLEGLVEKKIAIAIGEALIDVNVAGGVFGAPVTMLPRRVLGEEKADPKALIAELKKGRANAVILSCSEETTLALAPLLADAGIVALSVTSTAMDVRTPSDRSHGMLLRLVPSTEKLAGALSADVLGASSNGLTPRLGALVVRDGLRGRSLAEQLAQVLIPGAGQLDTYFCTEAKPFSEAKKLVARKPSLTIIDGGPEAAGIVSALREATPRKDGRAEFELPLRLLAYATRDMKGKVPAEAMSSATGQRPGAAWSHALITMMVAADISLGRDGVDFCAQAYDALALIALGAIASQSVEGSRIGAAIPPLLRGSNEVQGYETAARALSGPDASGDIAYQGFTGPLDLRDGDVAKGQLTTVTYRDDGDMGDSSATSIGEQ